MFLSVVLWQQFHTPLWIHCRNGFMGIVFHDCLVQGFLLRAISAAMEVPPNDDPLAWRYVDINEGDLFVRIVQPGTTVRMVPTQIDGRFCFREHIVINAAGTPPQTELDLDNVLVHFQDMNGEWLHSELIKECEAMQDVEAVLYYKLREKIAADMCYRLVWRSNSCGPYPFRCGEHSGFIF